MFVTPRRRTQAFTLKSTAEVRNMCLQNQREKGFIMTGGRKRLAEENKVISASYEQWFVVCAVTQFDEMIRKIRWWKDTAVLKHEEVPQATLQASFLEDGKGKW